jgi:uncharacterized membrane protein
VSTESEPTARASGPLLALAVGVVLVVAIGFRFATRSDLWLDEALTVNIAKLPLGDLHEALKHDGAPPLYYVLLHGWIRVFGSGDGAVRALSGVLGVAMLPLAYLAGLRLAAASEGLRRQARFVAWAAVLVVASSPYAIRYSTEARMYMLAMDLVLVGYLLLRAAVARPTWPRLGGIALVTVALLLTQYWALFLLAVVGVTQLARALWAPRAERRTAWRIVGALVLGGVLFLPWLPTFLYQQEHTGTPWDTRTSPPTNAALGILDFAGGKAGEGWALVLPLVVLGLLALFGRAIDRRHVELDVRTRPGVRWEWLIGAGTLVVGLCLSFVAGTGFQSRYAAVMWPLFALAIAFGLLAFGDRRIRFVALAVVVVLGFAGGIRNVVDNRTQASQAVDVIAAEGRAGDVIAYCPDQLGPDVSRLVPGDRGLRQYAFPDLQSPRFVDWVDYASRNHAASVDEFVDRVLERAGDHRVWLVWSPRYLTFEGKCEAIVEALARRRPQNAIAVTPDESFYEFMGLRRYDP